MFVETKSKAHAQSLWQHLDTQSLVPSRRSQPRSPAEEDLPGDVASRSADGQDIRLNHRFVVGDECRPIRGQVGRRESEQRPE
jgi:hypothetical protein